MDFAHEECGGGDGGPFETLGVVDFPAVGGGAEVEEE